MNKKHASGAEKRKRNSNIQAQIAKLPKISTFFAYISEVSSSQEDEQEDPEGVQEVVIKNLSDSNGQTETLTDEPPVLISKLSDMRAPSNDPALWNLDDEQIEYWDKCRPQTCRNRDGIYFNSERRISGKNR